MMPAKGEQEKPWNRGFGDAGISPGSFELTQSNTLPLCRVSYNSEYAAEEAVL